MKKYTSNQVPEINFSCGPSDIFSSISIKQVLSNTGIVKEMVLFTRFPRYGLSNIAGLRYNGFFFTDEGDTWCGSMTLYRIIE